jgi:protein SCO1/2
MLRSSLLLLAVVVSARPVDALAAHPGGQPAPEDPMPPPPSYRGNDAVITEQLGARIPLDARFQTSDGVAVTLGELLRSDVPTILTFNYSSCPMLCSLQLNGLSAALPAIDDRLRPGVQFRIVTIDLEPNEPLDKLREMKARYIARLPERARADAERGWTFLAAATFGDDAQIRRVAGAVGFGYTYLPERAEYAHPAALIFVSSGAAVTRYVYGIEFPPDVLRESIYKAGLAEPATAVGFMNRCYHYDPDANNHARAGVLALRLGAAGFAVLVVSTLGLLHFVRRSRR